MASTDLVALLSPYDEVTRLSLFRDGLPRFERSLALSGEALVAEINRCIAFYRRSDPAVRGLRLLHSGSLPEAEALTAALGVAAEPTHEDPFDSLILQGLASLEAE
jgi:hypothetical protein